MTNPDTREEIMVEVDQDLYITMLLTPEDQARIPDYNPSAPVVAPTVSALDPATAEVGADPVVMLVTGTDFLPTSRILFNGGAEPTIVVSATELTTTVDPRTASGAFTVPVLVENHGLQSAPLDFTFTEPVEER